MRQALRRMTSLLVLAGLTACGFHLQGAARVSPRLAAVELVAPDRYSDLQQALRESLSLSGARLVEVAGSPTATLRLTRDEHGRRVLSVSARNTPREVEVFYTAEFSIESGGQVLVPVQEITLTRSLSYDETALLAKEQEQEQVRAALAREVAALITRRLAALP
jgi:LPS-assembly lipoprotein